MAKTKTASRAKPAKLPIALVAEMPRGGLACDGLVFSPDAAYLAAYAGERKLHIYDVAAGKSLHQSSEHLGGISSACFSPDSTRLASGSVRKVERRGAGVELLIWNVAAGQVLNRVTMLPENKEVGLEYVKFSPSGKHVVCVIDNYDDDQEASHLAIIDAAAGKVTRLIPIEDYGGDLAFSPDGKTLSGAFQGKLVHFTFPSGKQRQSIKLSGRTAGLAYSPDGETIAWADQKGAVIVHDTATGKAKQKLQESSQHLIESVQFSRDGLRLATIGQTIHGTSQAEVRIWDLKSGQVIVGFPGRTGVEALHGFPGAVALSADFSLFANAGRKTRLWQVSP